MDQQVELLHVKILAVAEAPGAVAFVAIEAEEAVLEARDDRRAPLALDGLVARVRTDHALACLELRALLVSVHARLAHAEAEALL